MKNTLFSLACCLISFYNFAQPGNVTRYDSKMTYNLLVEDKDPHILFIGCKEGECDIYWNDQKLGSEYSFNAAVDFIIPIKNKDYPNLFLLPVYNGDGCPSTYKVLHIADKKTYYLTQAFGNCNEPEYSIKKKLLIFTFEGTKQPVNRAPMRFSYHLKKGTLEKL